jgi:carbon-monoxide dehydrogenase small subunit
LPVSARAEGADLLVHIEVNGIAKELELEDNALLIDVLRDRLGLTGTKRSCDVQVCGTCTVLVDEVPVSSCCYLAADAHQRTVETVEGFAEQPLFADLAAAFTRHNAFQCGFCAPGFLMALKPALESGQLRTREDVCEALADNICRCTGYRAIIDAVTELAEARA